MSIIDGIELFFKTYSSLTGFLSVLISGFTLFLAFRISKQFGLNHIKTKQIDHVCSLIEYLNRTTVEIDFSTNSGHGAFSGTGIGVSFNVFEIGSYDELDAEGLNKKYEDERVLFDQTSNQLLKIKKFINHPLTPKKLADELMNFYNSYSCSINLSQTDIVIDNFVVLGTKVWNKSIVSIKQDAGTLNFGDAIAFKSWLNLKEYSKKLKIAIGDWLLQNGIDENNIRSDFKNR